MEATEGINLKIDSILKKENPELYSELDSFKKELDERKGLGFTLAMAVLLKYINEMTSTEKKIAYLLNDKIAYYIVENNYLEDFLEAIQLMKKEQAIYIKYFSTLENPETKLKYLENPKKVLEFLEAAEGIVEDTVEHGLDYYKELVENTTII